MKHYEMFQDAKNSNHIYDESFMLIEHVWPDDSLHYITYIIHVITCAGVGVALGMVMTSDVLYIIVNIDISVISLSILSQLDIITVFIPQLI